MAIVPIVVTKGVGLADIASYAGLLGGISNKSASRFTCKLLILGSRESVRAGNSDAFLLRALNSFIQ